MGTKYLDSAKETKQDTIDAIVDAILVDTGTTLPGEHTSIQNAVSAIQNNTRFTAAIPIYMCKPAAGNAAFKQSSNLYDTVGNMEDPANSEILLRVVKNDGTFITANLYKENALTNVLDSATDQANFPTASGWRVMERDAVGKYFFFYKVANDETEETLTVEFGWDEGGNINFQSRSTEVADVHGDLSEILADTNELQTDWKNGGRLDLLLDDVVAQTEERVAAKPQTKVVSVTSAANAAADTTLATITAGGCIIDTIAVHADAAQTADMTNAAVKGGAVKVITFIAAADLLQADVDAENKQVGWNTGAVYLPIGATIVMEHTGTGVTALDLTVVITYHAVADGGYLA